MTLPFDNAQNWWRHQPAELGVLGALQFSRGRSSSPPACCWPASAGAATPGCRARSWPASASPRCVGMPTQNPIVLSSFLRARGMVGHGIGGCRGRRPRERGGGPGAGLASLFVLVVLHAGAPRSGAGWLSVPERARRAHRDYIVAPTTWSRSPAPRRSAGRAATRGSCGPPDPLAAAPPVGAAPRRRVVAGARSSTRCGRCSTGAGGPRSLRRSSCGGSGLLEAAIRTLAPGSRRSAAARRHAAARCCDAVAGLGVRPERRQVRHARRL